MARSRLLKSSQDHATVGSTAFSETDHLNRLGMRLAPQAVIRSRNRVLRIFLKHWPQGPNPYGPIQVMLQMKNAVTRDLYCYWDGLREGHLVPDRAEVDPGAIRRVLADTFIVEIDAGRTFPYRLAGSRLCALMGHELRGESFLENFSGADRVEIERLVDAVIDESAAVVVGLEARSNQGHRLDLELLMMPLRHRGPENTRILGSIAPSEQPFWLAVCPVEALCVRSVRVLWPSGRTVFGASTRPTPLPGARRLAHLTVVDGGRN